MPTKSLTCQNVDAGAQSGSDAESGQVERVQNSGQLGLAHRVALDLFLSGQETRVSLPCRHDDFFPKKRKNISEKRTTKPKPQSQINKENANTAVSNDDKQASFLHHMSSYLAIFEQ